MGHGFLGNKGQKYILLGLLCIGFSAALRLWVGGNALLFSVLFWGVCFFTPLLMDLFPWLFRQHAHHALSGLQGKHYVFQRTPVKVFYARDEVWLSTRDLYHALGIPLSRSDLHHLLDEGYHRLVPGLHLVGISENRLEKALRLVHSPEKERFLHWFQRQVAAPIHAKAERGLPIAEQID